MLITVPGPSRAFLVALLMLGSSAGAAAGQPGPDPAQARTLAARFKQALEARLLEAMARGGPAHAIEICRTDAPALAQRIGEAAGWQVRRTSLRVRNPANAPDPWERAVLERFEREAAAGADPATLEYHETMDAPQGPVLRYMKAIPTAAPCLTCHGEGLAPPVRDALDRLYPQDRARGFSAGDLRGAFTLRHPR